MTVNEHLKKIEIYPEDTQKILNENIEIWSNHSCIAYFEFAAKKIGLNQEQISEISESMEKAFSAFSVDEICCFSEEEAEEKTEAAAEEETKTEFIEKYFLRVGKYKFTSVVPFCEMGFADSDNVLQYVTNRRIWDHGKTINVFDDEESAKQKLYELKSSVISIPCCEAVEHFCKIPFVERVIFSSSDFELSHSISCIVCAAPFEENLQELI